MSALQPARLTVWGLTLPGAIARVLPVFDMQLRHLHAQPSSAYIVCAYCGRWEGRPSTPPFQWGDSGEVLPPHDQWLRDMNMAAWGLDKLVEPALLLTDPGFLHQDLQATKVTGCPPCKQLQGFQSGPPAVAEVGPMIRATILWQQLCAREAAAGVLYGLWSALRHGCA